MAGAPQFSTADHFARKLGLFYAAYFFFGGIQLPFFPLWLEARGLDAQTIGLVIAVPMLVRIVATPLMTHRPASAARSRPQSCWRRLRRRWPWRWSAWCTGGWRSCWFMRSRLSAFSPLLPLTDAYALSGLSARGRAYGPVRLWGSAAFVGGNIVAGLMLERFAPGGLIWLIVGALVLVGGRGGCARSGRAGGEGRTRGTAGAIRRNHCSRNPAFIAVALASGAIQSSHALYYGFSTVEWRAAGFDGTLIGALWGIGVIAEIALFALSGRLAGAAPARGVDRDRRRGRDAALDRDGVRSAGGGCCRCRSCMRRRLAATHLGLMGFMAHRCRASGWQRRRASSRRCRGW